MCHDLLINWNIAKQASVQSSTEGFGWFLTKFFIFLSANWNLPYVILEVKVGSFIKLTEWDALLLGFQAGFSISNLAQEMTFQLLLYSQDFQFIYQHNSWIAP